MNGICSKHQNYYPECQLCNVNLEDNSEFQEMRQRAIAAGLYTCDCGFEYYKTVLACPKCGKTEICSVMKNTNDQP